MITAIQNGWSRLKTTLRPFARHESRRGTLGLFAILVALLLVVTWLNVWNSYVNNHFMTALAGGQVDRFWALALVYAGVFGIIALVASCQRFVEEWLGLRLRKELTLHVIGRYLADHTYHRLTARDDIDNPDQRIADDIKTFTANSLSFALIVLNSTVNLISFASVLWSITPRLVVAALVYAGFGTVGSILLGSGWFR
jgi:vitamin B12/bleomycin/antimicrobial peptide transport system ATP-binding/permease protein